MHALTYHERPFPAFTDALKEVLHTGRLFGLFRSQRDGALLWRATVRVTVEEETVIYSCPCCGEGVLNVISTGLGKWESRYRKMMAEGAVMVTDMSRLRIPKEEVNNGKERPDKRS